MIKYFKVRSLNGVKGANFELHFNPDLNILTGRNGSGKTTLMKLLWYLITPNRRIALESINFEYAAVETDFYRLEISAKTFTDGVVPKTMAKWRCVRSNATELTVDTIYEDGFTMLSLEQLDGLDLFIEQSGERKTVFFPTFRRLEGGFDPSVTSRRARRIRRIAASGDIDLSVALENYSQVLTSPNHQFVASISTRDIDHLLQREYASRTEMTNRLYLSASRQIESWIDSEDEKVKENVSMVEQESVSLMEKIKRLLGDVKLKDTENRRPFKVLSNMISELFQSKGIFIDSSLSFGSGRYKIGSNRLSAGEKQMLGFLSYNALIKNATIFIDEPELSLHVDWQRILFRKLLEQQSNNQFIISTHSPFIYSQYPEKEIFLSQDRGCN